MKYLFLLLLLSGCDMAAEYKCINGKLYYKSVNTNVWMRNYAYHSSGENCLDEVNK